MINVSSEFKRSLYSGNKNYLNIINMELADGTNLVIENDKIMENGIQFEDAVGEDESFSALGSAVINGFTLVLNNIYDDFSDYNFTDAKITRIRIGLQLSETIEYIDKGVFTVEDTNYNGAFITLSCIDNMHKFDKPYSESTLVYPARLDTIVLDLCSVCGVSLDPSSLIFPRCDYIINTRPSGESTTCREVLSWCATIAGCFARCNTVGKLELKWFETDLFDGTADDLDGGIFDNYDPNSYATGDDAEGGVFNPWEEGTTYNGGSFAFNDLQIIGSLYSQNISVDDVVITQVQIEVKVQSEETSDAIEVFTAGQPGYTVKIEQNDFINETNAQSIVNYLGNQLIGVRFRKANITHLSDPTIEAGDCAFVYDRKGNKYQILITRTNFSVGNSQVTVCGAENPVRNSATRFTEATKSYVELRKQLIKQKNAWEEAEEDLEERINNAGGLYETDVTQSGGGVIHYLHDKPDLEDSNILIVVSTTGITVSADGGNTWYGLEVNGALIVSILNAIGINASWINSGQLVIKDQNNNETFFADTTTGVVRINATQLTINSNPVPSSADLNDAKKIATNYLSYNNNDGITLGYVNTNEKINIKADGMELYDGSNNQVAQFKAVTRIGPEDLGNLKLDYHSLQLQDVEGNTYVHLSDVRGNNLLARVTQTYTGTGYSRSFRCIYHLYQLISATVDGRERTDVIIEGDYFTFTGAYPSQGSTILFEYDTDDSIRGYTFGTRDRDGNIGHDSLTAGQDNFAAGKCSQAYGFRCRVWGDAAVAQGTDCAASANSSFASGINCKTGNNASVAMGKDCTAKGLYSFATGENCITAARNQHVLGQYNVETMSYIFIVGGGTETSRKNALTLYESGNMTIAGTLTQQSDKRLKHHRAYLSDQQDQVNEFINRLKPAWFEKDEQKHLGFYAQDVQQTDRWHCMVDTDSNGYLTLGYTELLAPLVAYCQNLEQKVESLEQRIERLEQLLNNQ